MHFKHNLFFSFLKKSVENDPVQTPSKWKIHIVLTGSRIPNFKDFIGSMYNCLKFFNPF